MQARKALAGIAHDILAEITRITRIKFEIVNQPDTAWPSLQETLESGGAAMVTELMQTKDRVGRFLWPRHPYMEGEYVFLSRTKTSNVSEHQVTQMKVAVMGGSSGEEVFHRLFPGHPRVVVVDSAKDGFDALEKGHVDLVIMSESLILHMTSYSARPEFKVNLPLGVPGDSYFGFNMRESLLCGIVDKAQKLVDCENIAARWKDKTFDYQKMNFQARLPYLIGAAALLLGTLILLLTHARKKANVSRQLSMLDHLTGLANRRHFDERTRAEWEKAVRERLNISLLAIDIDHFKKINDTYGHPQGDKVLCAVARTLESAEKGATDLAARMGGEEFSVLLPNTDLEGAYLVAERIRSGIEDTAIDNLADGPPIKVTASVGVASMKPRPGDSVKDLESRSDQALYTAKQNGRNRTCTAFK